MGISLVSSSTGTDFSAIANTNDIAQLEKQKAALQRQLQKISQSSDDAKTKEILPKQIQTKTV